MRLRPYMVIGGSDNGFLFDIRQVSIPGNITDEKVFPEVVNTFFDKVDGLLWGVVMGPKSIAKA